MRIALSFLCFVSCTAFAQIQIENPWSRATPPGAKTAVGYLTLKNDSAAPDRLVGASSPAAAKVETHITVKDGDVMKMRMVKGYAIPAHGRYELKPGGSHLMLVDIKKPLQEGDKVPLTLRFEKAGEVTVEMPVRALGSSVNGGMDMNRMDMKMH